MNRKENKKNQNKLYKQLARLTSLSLPAAGVGVTVRLLVREDSADLGVTLPVKLLRGKPSSRGCLSPVASIVRWSGV
jgi:hypothetical protein